MTTLPGYRPPAGLAQSTGRIVFDAWRVVREPGLHYWQSTVMVADRLVRRAGPLAWLLCLFQGMFTTIQGASALSNLGADPGLVGMIVSNLSLREMTLVVGTTAMAASMGAGYVTELGAMRVGEEIDAVESLGIRSWPYLVSTRVTGAVIAAVPIFTGAILATFAGGWFAAVFQANNVNTGNFAMWFNLGFGPLDIMFTLLKGIIATAIVAIVCASWGYRAQGGPVGVGMAVGEAMNLTMVLVMIVNLLLTYLFWGMGDMSVRL